MGEKPNTMRRFTIHREGATVVAEGVRFTNGYATLYWLVEEWVRLYADMATVRAQAAGEVVYVDPDPACPYCYGWGVSDNAHCHCYGPATDHSLGNLAIRKRVETEHGM